MDIRVRVAILAIVLNVALVVVKIVLAQLSGSASIRADAIHSLSDVLVSVLVLVGVGLGAREARKGKEGGAGRPGIEHVVAIVVGLFILYAAFGIFRQAVSSPTRSLAQVPISLVGIFVCVLGSYLISRIEIQVGRSQGSPALVADGFHARMNMYTSIGVMVSLVGVMIGLNLDSAAAAVIALLIAVTGVEVVVGSARGLARGRPIAETVVYQFVQRKVLRYRGDDPAQAPGTALLQVRPPRRVVIFVSLALIVLAWLLSAVSFTLPGERLLVFRFGRSVGGERGPGVHFHLPWPIDRSVAVDVGKIRRAEIGFRTSVEEYSVTDRSYQWESRHTAGAYVKKLGESVMLTGDVNLVDVNSVVQYRVSDAACFLLASEDPEQVVRVATEAALRQVVGRERIDELLTTDRRMIEDACRDLAQTLVEPYRAGIELIGVRLQDVHPPLEVVASFRDVASAREDRSRLINEALAYRNQLLPRSRGEAEKNVLTAGADAVEKVERSVGEADRFLSVLKQYRRSPEVTETRMYLETLEGILPGMDKFVVESEAGEGPLDLRFYRGGLQPTADMLGGQ